MKFLKCKRKRSREDFDIAKVDGLPFVRFRIREAMQKYGIGEQVVAEKCGLSTKEIDKLEEGKLKAVRISTLATLFGLFNCSADELIE